MTITISIHRKHISRGPFAFPTAASPSSTSFTLELGFGDVASTILRSGNLGVSDVVYAFV